jgi:hypothetical protein
MPVFGFYLSPSDKTNRNRTAIPMDFRIKQLSRLILKSKKGFG